MAGTTRHRTTPPWASPATSASTSVMVTSTSRLRGRSAAWPSSARTRQQRPNAPTTRRDRDRVGRVPIGKVVARDDPGDVDLRARAQAGCDAQGDPVHGLSLRARGREHVAEHRPRLGVLPRLGGPVEREASAFGDAARRDVAFIDDRDEPVDREVCRRPTRRRAAPLRSHGRSGGRQGTRRTTRWRDRPLARGARRHQQSASSTQMPHCRTGPSSRHPARHCSIARSTSASEAAGIWNQRSCSASSPASHAGASDSSSARRFTRGRRWRGLGSRTVCAQRRCLRARRRARRRPRPRHRDRASRGGRRARCGTGGSDRACRLSASASTSRRPSAGPEAIETATARLSSMTGEPVASTRRSYSSTMRCQSVSSTLLAREWHAAIAACSVYGPGSGCSASARLERDEAEVDVQPVPTSPVLIREQHDLARRPEPSVEPRRLQLHQRDEPVDFGLVGRQARELSPEPQRLMTQIRASPLRSGRRGVALVEDDVDHLRAPMSAASSAPRPRAPRTARPRRRSSSSRARSAARRCSRAGGRPGRSRPSRGRRPVEASARLLDAIGSTGWHATNIIRSRSSSISPSSTSGSSVGLARQGSELLVLGAQRPVTPKPVDGLSLRDRHQPRPGVARHAVAWPLHHRVGERVLCEVFSEADVVHLCGRGPRRDGGTRCETPSRSRGWSNRSLRRLNHPRPARDCEQGHSGPNTGRTRTSPSPSTPRNRFDHSTASARSRHSINAQPPMSSFASVNGPSTTVYSPFAERDLRSHRRRCDASGRDEHAGAHRLVDEDVHLLHEVGVRRGHRARTRHPACIRESASDPPCFVALHGASNEICADRHAPSIFQDRSWPVSKSPARQDWCDGRGADPVAGCDAGVSRRSRW